MKELKHKKETNSYMQICLYADGKNPLYLLIPTYWDPVKKEWLGMIQTPIAKKLIHCHGKDSSELESNFIIALNEASKENEEEIISMFKPLEYWESRL